MSDFLTFNQSIFGTNIKERSLSKKAKKAQIMELYTPDDSDVIIYDESYDIDGGTSIARGILATAIDTLIVGICLIPGVGAGVATLLGIKNVGRFFGKGLAKAFFKHGGKTIIMKLLSLAFAATCSYLTNTTLSIVCDNICDNLFSSLSLGGIISMGVDAIDGSFDGYITF